MDTSLAGACVHFPASQNSLSSPHFKKNGHSAGACVHSLAAQTTLISTHFKDNDIKESAWLSCCYNSYYVQRELSFQPLVVEYGASRVSIEEKKSGMVEEGDVEELCIGGDSKHTLQERDVEDLYIVGMDKHVSDTYNTSQNETLVTVKHALDMQLTFESDTLVTSNYAPDTNLTSHSDTLVALLRACVQRKDLRMGSKIHEHIATNRLLSSNVFVGNTLINMYAKCNVLKKAQEVFDELSVKNIVSWNVLIAGYAQQGYGEEALYYMKQMQLRGFCPNAVTFACTLKACGSIGAIDKGQALHAQIVRDGFLDEDVHVGSALVSMYAKCGTLAKAQEVLDALPVRNSVSWTALITEYAEHGHGAEALNCFERMQLEGFPPDAVTFACILKACSSIGAADNGQKIHAQIVKEPLLGNSLVVANGLVDMYAKCGALEKAREVFDALSARDVVSWNALIGGYAQHGYGEEALDCFERMQLEGYSPNGVTFVCILKACGIIGALDKGQEIHAQIIPAGLLLEDVHVGTALVDMYLKCGLPTKAQDVFDNLPVRTKVSWTVLVSGYAQHGHCEEALICFDRMQLEGCVMDGITVSCVLKACGSIGAVGRGQELHAELMKDGLLEGDLFVDTALVDMYANCGMLQEAQDVFDKLSVRDVVTWNALMVGYAQLGKEELVFELFGKMKREGKMPDLVTFTIVLNTCSHRGLLNNGQMYFEVIKKCYDIHPTLEHHTCMIDLFGRAGHLGKAMAILEEMPFSANLISWHSLLGACRKWENLKFGKWAFEYAVQMDDADDATYSYLSNIYTAAGS